MDNKSLLKWQVDMGADEAVSNKPVNRMVQKLEKKEEKPVKSQKVTNSVSKPSDFKPTPPMEAEKKAREIADSAKSLKDLKEKVSNFDGLAIKKTATNTVFSDGNEKANIMLIGEAPGANEDEQGIPFCGGSGQLLDKMFAWVGITRKDNLYISNTIFWRPPGNRKPTPEELAICKPLVEKHIALLDPKLLILSGATANFAVLGEKTGITKIHGQFLTYKNDYMKEEIPVMAIFHPSFLLRQPSQKKHFWHDLLKIREYVLKNKIAKLPKKPVPIS